MLQEQEQARREVAVWENELPKIVEVDSSLSLLTATFLLVSHTMSETKTYTWEELRTEEAKSKEGILMLLHGKGNLSLTCISLSV